METIIFSLYYANKLVHSRSYEGVDINKMVNIVDKLSLKIDNPKLLSLVVTVDLKGNFATKYIEAKPNLDGFYDISLNLDINMSTKNR